MSASAVTSRRNKVIVNFMVIKSKQLFYKIIIVKTEDDTT